MLSVSASLTFLPSELEWTFRSPCRSMLFRFHEGETDEILAGAIATWMIPEELRPGCNVAEATLEFWADPEMAPYLRTGETFRIWHIYDLGRGVIRVGVDERT